MWISDRAALVVANVYSIWDYFMMNLNVGSKVFSCKTYEKVLFKLKNVTSK